MEFELGLLGARQQLYTARSWCLCSLESLTEPPGGVVTEESCCVRGGRPTVGRRRVRGANLGLSGY